MSNAAGRAIDLPAESKPSGPDELQRWIFIVVGACQWLSHGLCFAQPVGRLWDAPNHIKTQGPCRVKPGVISIAPEGLPSHRPRFEHPAGRSLVGSPPIPRFPAQQFCLEPSVVSATRRPTHFFTR